ncbi:Vitellogenin-like protein [Hirschfeldia incana]|nr:Vitellogenin-like protein [Hirschfeldia incana]
MLELKDQDMGEGIQCTTHPYTKNPGGICPLCLQEKLGKLVTSSFPLPKPNHLSSSSSPPKAFSPSSTTSLALSLSSGRDSNNNSNNNLPFLLAKKKSMLASSSSSSSSAANLIYKRSKSTAAAYGEGFSQSKRSGFWSFLHLYSSKHQLASTTKKVSHSSRPRNQRSETTETPKRVVGRGGIDVIVEEEDESPNNKVVVETPTNSVGSGGGGGGGGSSFGRKVLRSRSVGCGSRSFSGDFFERISNGFGDCALRRIESQREHTKVISNGGGGEAADDAVSEMVKCGGIFSGFMIMPSASSTVVHHKMGNRSWGWGFASPMRAKTTTHRGRTITESSTTDKNTSPNLDSIPSLVAMKS